MRPSKINKMLNVRMDKDYDFTPTLVGDQGTLGIILSYLNGNHPDWYITFELAEGMVWIKKTNSDKLNHIKPKVGESSYLLRRKDYFSISNREAILLADKIQKHFERCEQ